jgi:hypothetical protein
MCNLRSGPYLLCGAGWVLASHSFRHPLPMRILLSLFLAITASAALAADPRIVTVPDQAPPQAQAPSSAPKPSQPAIPGLGEPPEAKPQAGQGGTEQSPWFVRVLPTPKTAGEAEAERREADARAANEQGLTTYTRHLSLATVALAFVAAVQAGLFVWQLILLRGSVRDARTAANAANASAEAAKLEAYAAQRMLILTQRPKLRVRNVVVRYPVPIHRQPFRLFEPGQPVSGQFYVVNIGGTVARLVEGDCRVYWTEQGLPMDRPYEGQGVETVVPSYKLEAGQSSPITFQSRNIMGPEGDDIRVFAGNWRLYVMGWIEYTDDLDNHRRTAFCREYRQIPGGSGGRFFPIDDPDYEHEE